MEDPIESRLRELMRGESEPLVDIDEQRLERVLHKAHLHAGVFDLINLFARWGWVLSEGGARGLRHARPESRRRAAADQSDQPDQQS
ncbi:MAG: hypothetical protein ACK4VV_13875 [Pseudomonas sp.]